ncbi:SOUL family heme-binding protein [Microbacterium lushaniae]|uniref:Heme-binding protein n=1 Tax=Microbacterium lushaniae TaxID=2614639 RepID=A0A5J6L8A7_9MICO|nr:heme-binding protein [Microbacterium lushaniae]QEW04687.1 heme-binding protein [Microbacterium lushaniae]
MTEQQPYEVVRTFAEFELRHYPEHAVAEVMVDGRFEDAGNRAFRYLFSYISGENEPAEKMAMTAPVVQERQGTKIAMTAPVVREPIDGGADTPDSGDYLVAFVLPAALTAATAPRPTNARVRVHAVPERLVAALRYRGRWTEDAYEEHLDRLRAALAAEGLAATGDARFARFDPPLWPAFLRHNEVMLDVSGQAIKEEERG